MKDRKEELITKKILWIEDSAYSLKSLVKPLEEKGYRIIYADTESKALEVLAGDKFDLILFDIILPSGSDDPKDFTDYVGVRLAEEIVINRKIKTPIIGISVVNNPIILEKLEDLGFKKILPKGHVLPSDLLRDVEKILCRK
jgi:CheY-like chemotaxis protein